MSLKTEHARIDLIDVIRGFALLGVFTANMRFFNSSYLGTVMGLELWPGKWNAFVKTAIEMLVAGKFISIFSFLFGFGMIIMMERAQAKNSKFTTIYARRLLAMIIFGLIHGLFIWFGDILLHYALMGFLLLLLFRNRKPRTMLIWSIVLMSVLPLFMLIVGGGSESFDTEQFQLQLQQAVHTQTQIYSQGSFGQIMAMRFSDWLSSFFNQVTFAPYLLGMFVLGCYFAKKKIFHQAADNGRLLLRLCGLTLLACLLLYGLKPFVPENAGEMLKFLTWPLGAIFMMTLIAILFQKARWRKWLLPFSYVGRMAFTNYIMQSVICTFIFYSYGLGMFGKVSDVTGLGITIVIFALQMLLSKLWLSRFKMGPLEWAWRKFTYWGR
ncbi:DUF418 domain-containing protein [Paenibacillus sp. NPDC058174]|uniref:DUF418 domain-containing protein n=1 Tax=Paenibacillus sp. NPDC058174 TaxID=3346366 RepID=UPI0036DAA6B0